MLSLSFFPTCVFQQAPLQQFRMLFWPLWPFGLCLRGYFCKPHELILNAEHLRSHLERLFLQLWVTAFAVSICRLRGFTAVRRFLPSLYFVLGPPTLTRFASLATSSGFRRGFSPFAHTKQFLTVECRPLVVSFWANLNAGVSLLRGLIYHGCPPTRIDPVSKIFCILVLVLYWVTHEAPTSFSSQNLKTSLPVGMKHLKQVTQRYRHITWSGLRQLILDLYTLPLLSASSTMALVLSPITRVLVTRSRETRKRPIKAWV